MHSQNGFNNTMWRIQTARNRWMGVSASGMKRIIAAALTAVMLAGAATPGMKADIHQELTAPPQPQREFRGVWVATVANIDWPSKPGLSVKQQQAELIGLLDKAVLLHLNAIIFQVRPACDAMYDSKIEPWSEYLTGQQGRAPEPYYDPLAYVIAEAHRRGLELHAWFNPYRARHLDAKSPISANHISRLHPELVRTYGRSLWLDPGSEAVQDYTTKVVMDVVKRYDIDGVHIDDYFYPYKILDAQKQVVPFPDEPTWQEYLRSGGTEGRDDWRRENVNTLIERLYKAIKKEKSWVKFGISPFGIWRPGNPAQIKGFDAYQELYADSRKWIKNGWCDYLSPQLYWQIGQAPQSYPVLLKWWLEQNPKKRHIWAGNYTGRVADGSKTSWPREEVVNQIAATRNFSASGATGNVHYSMKCLLNNKGGIADALASVVYSQPALVPESPWLRDHAPGKPKIAIDSDDPSGHLQLSWKPAGKEQPWLWVVQAQIGGAWTTRILPAGTQSLRLDAKNSDSQATAFAVSEVDRYGMRSAISTVKSR